MKINGKIKKAMAMAVVVGSLCAGGTMAYLTDNENAINEFTVGSVEIELLEPNWKPENNKTLVPTQEILKDPQIKHKGKSDAFVYLEVRVPIKNVITADEEGKRTEARDNELFSFTAGKDWTLLQSEKKDSSHIYVYAYNKILKPSEITAPLFEKVIFANVIEGQLDAQKMSIPVKAYAIQSANTGGNSGSVIEQAKIAFQKYINQNKENHV